MPDRNTYLQSLKGMQRIKGRLRRVIYKMESQTFSISEIERLLSGAEVTDGYRTATRNYTLITKNIRALRHLINQTYHHGKSIV